MPERAPANLVRGRQPHSAAERRWWLWGIQQRHPANRRAGFSRHQFRGALSRVDARRPDHSRSVALARRHLAAAPPKRGSRPRPLAYALAGAAAPRAHDSDGQRSRAPRGHRAFRRRRPIASAPCRWRLPATFAPWRRLRPRRSLFFCSWPRSSRARMSPALVEGWRESRAETDADLVIAGPQSGRFRRKFRPARVCIFWAKSRIRNCRGSIPMRWRSFTPRIMRASGCRCSKPCSADAR